MSKGIDYTKWDNFRDDDEEVDEVVGDRTDSRTNANQEGTPQPKYSYPYDISGNYITCEEDAKIEAQLCRDFLMGGNVNSRITQDCFSASLLLYFVNPEGLQERKDAPARGEELPLIYDPVHAHLRNLTIKLRKNVKHDVEELLAEDAVQRIMQVISACDFDKYLHMDVQHPNLEDDTRRYCPSEATKNLKIALQLRSDIMDIYSALSVLHEMCRYSCGCLAVAQYEKGLKLLLVLPSLAKQMTNIALVQLGHVTVDTSARGGDSASNTVGPERVDLGSPSSYQIGMIEQAVLDTVGRLLHGLDQHSEVQQMVADRLLAVMDRWEKHMKSTVDTLGLLSMKSKWEVDMHHCIDIEGTLAKLRKSLSEVGCHNHPKRWRSTFRLDRTDVPTASGEQQYKESSVGQGKCSVCAKEKSNLHQCGRCRSVLYCSRECQVKDWKVHKKNCVKRRGDIPTDTSFSAGHTYKEA